ncbi:MAG: phage head-tail adapter protein, partial [Acinetobacter sp.]
NGRGVPQNIMRTADEVKELRDIRQKAQEAQAQQQQQQAMMEMAGGAVAKGMEKQMGTEVMQ